MQNPREKKMNEEVEGVAGGPGLIATRTQARSGGIGAIVGAVIGALIGLLVGLLLFDGGRAVVISVVALAVGGAVFGGVAAGITRSMNKLEESGGPDT
jgi:uncharacterized protein (DUF697 family)